MRILTLIVLYELQILINDWLPRVADLIDLMQSHWRDLVLGNNAKCGRGQYFFNCIHALMSQQLTQLIRRSVTEFHEILLSYTDGNCQMDKIQLKRKPFMTISVSVVGKSYASFDHGLDRLDSKLYVVDKDDPMLRIDECYPSSVKSDENEREKGKAEAKFILDNSGKMYIDPYMNDLEEQFMDYFKQILRVGYKIPRIEYFMSHGNFLLSKFMLLLIN